MRRKGAPESGKLTGRNCQLHTRRKAVLSGYRTRHVRIWCRLHRGW